MCTEEVVPAVTIDDSSSLAVDSDVWILSVTNLSTGLRIELNHADEAEVSTVCAPETTCCRIKEETGVDSVAVLIVKRSCYLDRLSISKIRRVRIKSLVPHCKNATSVSTTESTTCSTVSDKVTVSDLECIRSSSTAWADSATEPVVSVLRDESATTGTECIVLAITLHDVRRVMNPWLTFLCES